jgi:hypothetical protein
MPWIDPGDPAAAARSGAESLPRDKGIARNHSGKIDV